MVPNSFALFSMDISIEEDVVVNVDDSEAEVEVEVVEEIGAGVEVLKVVVAIEDLVREVVVDC